MKALCKLAILIVCSPSLSTTAAPTSMPVRKLAEGFEHAAWRCLPGTSAATATLVDDPAPQPGSTRSLLLEIASPKGPVTLAPRNSLVIPGDGKTVDMRVKVNDPGVALGVSFRDGWGRDKVDGKPLRWDLPRQLAVGEWHSASFHVPNDWVRPVEIVRISAEPLNAPKQPIRIQLDHIEVETDIAGVDPSTGLLTTWKPDPKPQDPKTVKQQPPKTDLVSVELSLPAEGNVFAGIEPRATITVRNWRPGEIKGLLKYRVVDEREVVVASDDRQVRVDSVIGFDLPLKAERFGLFVLHAELAHGAGERGTQTAAFAHIPKPRELSDEQKTASPYGLNFHGIGRLMLKPFRDAGIVWFREYAFSYPRLLEAKGDGSYSGYPFFKEMVKGYEDVGAKLLPVLQRSITKPRVENGKVVGPVGPSAEWTRNIAHILTSFPSIQYWELSNEYDLPAENSSAEKLVNWENYKKYHATLADLVDRFSGGKGVTVENGRAGIFPDLVQDAVKSGYFDKIGVVNSHYYTGTEPPEESQINHNTHSDTLLHNEKGMFFDQLRAATRAGYSDGKSRQHWLTEFGWDTRAGPVVSPFEQAVFLQRGWMLAMAAGVEKAFWFYHFDAPKPAGFFDGCGLFTADAQPKLSLAALAGMTSILPTPKYVGTISAGENTAGYVFEQDGRLVAALFAIRGDGPPTTFRSEKLFDYLGNELPGNEVRLSMAPVYAVGLSAESLFYKQTAYSLSSPYLISATPGDLITPVVQIENRRSVPIACTITSILPEGWTILQREKQVTVAPGGKVLLDIRLTVGASEVPGYQRAVKFRISEGTESIREIEQKVNIQPTLVMRVAPMTGRPGPTQVVVTVGNNSVTPRDGVLRMKLPASWKTDTPEIRVEHLKPGEGRDIPLAFEWNPDYRADESALVELTSDTLPPVVRPIIPTEYQLHRASGIKVDGDLSEWNNNTALPPWMLGSTTGETKARIHVAWAAEGLYGAVEVRDSRVVNRHPTQFWAGDALEVFVNTTGNRERRGFGVGDHQFWLVPQPEQDRIYFGRWKVAKEIAATQYDLKQGQGRSRKTQDGYVMEFLLPADMMQDYQPQAGGNLGLNLNLTIRGQQGNREVFWPRRKADGVSNQIENWGWMKLVP